MKQAVHDGTRQWSNVGHVCTRCLHEVKAGEKTERFRTKGGRLRVRHVGECRSRRVAPSTDQPPWGCGCLDCLREAYQRLAGQISNLPYHQHEALYPLNMEADRQWRMALTFERDLARGRATAESLDLSVAAFRVAYEVLWRESRRFLND